MERVDVAVIGAGAVGLAIAARLSSSGKSVLILEKNESFGMETSSRNSEVIHAGIYYNPGSLKARLCVTGNPLLYDHLQRAKIRCKRLGKIIVATNDKEIESLHELMAVAAKNGVPGLKLLGREEVNKLEPNITAVAGVLSPTTGIFDTHSFMQSLLGQARSNGAIVSYKSEVTGIEKTNGGFRVTTGNNDFQFESSLVINSAGLWSDKVAALAGIDTAKARYQIHFCKGDYFRIKKPVNVNRLVYPVPQAHGLGVHITLDLAGNVRFGPDTEYVKNLDYRMDENKRIDFCRAARTYLPWVEPDNFYPDTSGIRPKLQAENDTFRDFVIKHEADKGLPGLINLIGIESPGLTSSLSIAEYVESIIKEDGILS